MPLQWLLPRPRLTRLPRTTPQPLVPRRIATTSTANTAPIDVPKLIVSHGSPHHNTLSSFLEYASHRNLDPSGTVYVGTHYEYTVLQSLMRLGFSLLRTGRRADAGIDLIGHWVLPPLREPMPTIMQCKARNGACGPVNIRELEGSLQRVPPGWRKKDVLGLLVTTANASSGVLQALGVSRYPLGFAKVTKRGTVEQLLWNRAATEKGLEGVGVNARYTPVVGVEENVENVESKENEDMQHGNVKLKTDGKGKKAKKVRVSGVTKDIQLTWMGTPIFPERDELVDETFELLDVISHVGRVVRRKGRKKAGRGRPKGSKNKPKDAAPAKRKSTASKSHDEPKPATPVVVEKRGRGRPPGSKNKIKPSIVSTTPPTTPRKRGRPKG